MSGAQDDTRGVFDTSDDEVEPDSGLEVEPELIVNTESPEGERHPKAHHPPPPPRVRAVAASQEGKPLSVSGEPKLARDLMTRQLFTVEPQDTLESLEQHMEAFRFRHLPVVEGNKVVGLISHTDLLHVSSSTLSTVARERNAIIHKLPASRIMRREIPSVRPTEPLAVVAQTMWKAHEGCVLVTEADRTLLGIITEADFVRLAYHYLTRDS